MSDVVTLSKELAELNDQLKKLQDAIAEKTAMLSNAVAQTDVSDVHKDHFMVAVKFSQGDTVYTYRTIIPNLQIGDIVVVPQKNGSTMAVVVGTDTKVVPVFEGSPVITKREFDLTPYDITKKMREEYTNLKLRMRSPSFFKVGIPYKTTDKDKFAVSIRFIGNKDEYTYLTDVETYQNGDLVIVPTGPFNLAKRAVVVRYVDYPNLPDVEWKRIYCPLRDYERMQAGMGDIKKA